MNTEVKLSHGVAALVACALVLAVLIIRTTDESSMVANFIEPQSQLAQINPTATLSLSPATNSVAVGSTFSVNIVLNTGGQAAYGVDINRLRFTPTILQVVDVYGRSSPVQIASGTLMTATLANTVDNINGAVQFSQIVAPVENTPNTYNGSGVLATVKFRVISGGTSNVYFEFQPGSGTDTNVAGLGGDMLLSVGGGSYTGTVTDSAPPSAPGTPEVSVVSSSQINLSWTASTDNVGVVGYRVERCTGISCTSFLQVASPSAASYSDINLSPNTTYSYRIRAVDGQGLLSQYSGVSTGTTQPPPDTQAPTISNVTLSNITTNSVTISWTTDELSDTQVEYGPTIGYGSQSTLFTTPVWEHTVTISSLAPGSSYNYRVKSRDIRGNIAVSADNTFSTEMLPDTTPPSAPTGFSARATSESQIQLSWNEAVDVAGTGQRVSGIKEYQIYRGSVLVGTTTSTAYLDSGLTPGVSYSYQVASVDKSNYVSTKSNVVSATTPIFSLAVQRKIILVLEGAPVGKRNVSGTIELIDPASLALVDQSSISTNAQGEDTINVISGLVPIVNMRPVIPGYLSKSVSGVDLRNTTVLDVVFPMLLAGNFYADKQINSLDFSYLNDKWGSNDALADINKDGAVNTLDFSYLSKNWFVTGE